MKQVTAALRDAGMTSDEYLDEVLIGRDGDRITAIVSIGAADHPDRQANIRGLQRGGMSMEDALAADTADVARRAGEVLRAAGFAVDVGALARHQRATVRPID